MTELRQVLFIYNVSAYPLTSLHQVYNLWEKNFFSSPKSNDSNREENHGTENNEKQKRNLISACTDDGAKEKRSFLQHRRQGLNSVERDDVAWVRLF